MKSICKNHKKRIYIAKNTPLVAYKLSDFFILLSMLFAIFLQAKKNWNLFAQNQNLALWKEEILFGRLSITLPGKIKYEDKNEM